MRPSHRLLIPLLCAIVVAGCTNVQPGVLTIASPTEGPNVLGSKLVLVKKAATKSATIPIVFGIPFGMVRDHEMIEALLKENNADIATNVVFTPRAMLVFWLFGTYEVDVTADLWKETALLTAQPSTTQSPREGN